MSRFVPSQRVISGLLIFLSLSAVYLYAFPQTNLIYPVVVLLHALAGLVAMALLLIFLWRRLRQESFFSRIGWALMAAGGILGLVLIKTSGRVELALFAHHYFFGRCCDSFCRMDREARLAGLRDEQGNRSRRDLFGSAGGNRIRRALCA